MRIRTFQGLVPASGREAEVAAVPYDVVNREEAAALVVDSPNNLLHVDRAEVDLPAEVSKNMLETHLEPTGTTQRDIKHPGNGAGTSTHEEHTIGEKDGFGDVVCDENDGLSPALPHTQEFQIQLLPGDGI